MCKVGDEVTISERGTRWCDYDANGNYFKTGNNPFGISGVVYRVSSEDESHLPVKVNWSNGRDNSYAHADLVLINFSLENK